MAHRSSAAATALARAPLRQLNTSVPYRIVELPDGTWCGFAKIQTPLGPIVVKATAHPNEEGKKFIAALRAAAARGDAVAGFSLGKLFKKIARAATAPIRATLDIGKKLAQGKIKAALQSAVRHVTSTPLAKIALPLITKNPAIQATLAAATTPFLGPLGPMIVGPALRMAGGLIDQARGGNPQARANIQQIVKSARAGNPRARNAYRELLKANNLIKRAPNFFQLASQQAMQYVNRASAPIPGMFAGEENGRWVPTAGGQVFVPNAYSAGFLQDAWQQIRPHAGYRSPGGALTLREAYYTGLRSSPR